MLVLSLVLLTVLVLIVGLLALRRVLDRLPDARRPRSAEEEQRANQVVSSMIISGGTEGFNGR
jgi:Tfp pilus assembly protein PilV